MNIPSNLRSVYANLNEETQALVKSEYSRRRKSTLTAYAAWFLLGWHYLYLKRVGLQFAFWLTAGGFLVWWFVDLFRIVGLVRNMNEDLARELKVQHKALQS